MKNILAALALALVLFSCQKSVQTPTPNAATDTARHHVKFTMANFFATNAPVSMAGTKSTAAIGDTLKNYASYLYYRIYKSDGGLVNSVNQTGASAGFGTITDRLPAGDYKVLVAASQGELVMDNAPASFNNAYFYAAGNNGWKDVFTTNFNLNVTNADINMPLRLERRVGGYQIVIEDTMPANVDKIAVTMESERDMFYYSGGAASNSQLSTVVFPVAAADKGLKNVTINGYTGATGTLVKMTIRALTSANQAVGQKTLINLQFVKNKRTIITGDLFSEPTNPTAGFTVTIDPDWTTKNIQF